MTPPTRDLSDPAVQALATEQIAVADALGWGMVCGSMSRAREIPDGPKAPKPLRGKSHVRGFPELLAKPPPLGREKDAEDLRTSNELMDFGFPL